jgi:3-methylcrotonyl-CoA carboxylase alpha subunit
VLFHQQPVGLPLAAACAVARRCWPNARWRAATRSAAAMAGARTAWPNAGSSSSSAASREGAPAYLHDGALHLQIGERAARPLAFAARGDAIEVHFAASACGAVSTRWARRDHVFTPRGATQIVVDRPAGARGRGRAEGGRLTAPMPGKVVSFAVKAGDKVKKGQALAVMEAMKMEHTIAAPADGTVAELLYAPGDQVAEGAELLKLAA